MNAVASPRSQRSTPTNQNGGASVQPGRSAGELPAVRRQTEDERQRQHEHTQHDAAERRRRGEPAPGRRRHHEQTIDGGDRQEGEGRSRETRHEKCPHPREKRLLGPWPQRRQQKQWRQSDVHRDDEQTGEERERRELGRRRRAAA